jgi:tetratricopeptide (TPR) repeat protein
MRYAIFALAIGFGSLVVSCGGSGKPADSAANAPMNPAEARAFIAELQTQRGVTPTPRAPVTKMEELVAIVNNDDVGRFEDAVRFVEGQPGVDALTLNAAIELAWSDAFTTVAALAEELAKRAGIEADRLGQKRDSGRDFTKADADALDQLGKEAAMLTKARTALRVLAEDHLRAGSTPTQEALRQFEKDPRPYRVAAFYYLLSSDWGQFDKAMARFEDKQAPPDAGIQYIRAMESLKRFGVRKDARAFLDQALKLNPKKVRAQAKLVLLQDEIEAKHADLVKLQAMAPTHPVVNIAGPSIRRAYEMATSLNRARAADQATPAAAPSAAPSVSPPAATPAK